MNPREKRLLIALLSIVGVGGAGIVGYQGFYKPLSDSNKQIARLSSEIDDKELLLQTTLEERKLLDRAREMSLSPNYDAATAEYYDFLTPLLNKSGLEIEDIRGREESDTRQAPVGAPNAVKAGHHVVSFQVRAKGELGQLVAVLEEIKKTPLLHRVRTLSIERIDKTAKRSSDRLNISMKIEAMIVNKTEPHISGPLAPDQRLIAAEALLALHRGPTGIALTTWVAGPTGPFARKQLAMEGGYRQYGELDRRNIFRGAEAPIPPADVAKKKGGNGNGEDDPDNPDGPPLVDDGIAVAEYIRLDTTDPDNKEAFLRNLIFNARPQRLRSTSWSGFNTFNIKNEWGNKILFVGKVLRIDQRDVYFQVREDVYGIHLGQSLGSAMSRALYSSELDRLDLTRLVDKDWGEKQQKQYMKDVEAQRKARTVGR